MMVTAGEPAGAARGRGRFRQRTEPIATPIRLSAVAKMLKAAA
jgi:hypothetical protein